MAWWRGGPALYGGFVAIIDRTLWYRLLLQAQPASVTLLGVAVLLPFVFVPTIVAMLAAVVLCGPTVAFRLLRPRREKDR